MGPRDPQSPKTPPPAAKKEIPNKNPKIFENPLFPPKVNVISPKVNVKYAQK